MVLYLTQGGRTVSFPPGPHTTLLQCYIHSDKYTNVLHLSYNSAVFPPRQNFYIISKKRCVSIFFRIQTRHLMFTWSFISRKGIFCFLKRTTLLFRKSTMVYYLNLKPPQLRRHVVIDPWRLDFSTIFKYNTSVKTASVCVCLLLHYWSKTKEGKKTCGFTNIMHFQSVLGKEL